MATNNRSPRLDQLFSALADPTRLRLLNLLARGEICVCYFVAILGVTQPKISRHLAYLRRAGIVRARREGKWVHYSLARPDDRSVARIFDAVIAELKSDEQLQRDADALARACCATKLPPALQDAPRPALDG